MTFSIRQTSIGSLLPLVYRDSKTMKVLQSVSVNQLLFLYTGVDKQMNSPTKSCDCDLFFNLF